VLLWPLCPGPGAVQGQRQGLGQGGRGGRAGEGHEVWGVGGDLLGLGVFLVVGFPRKWSVSLCRSSAWYQNLGRKGKKELLQHSFKLFS